MPPSGVLHNRSDIHQIGNEFSNENMKEHLTKNSKKTDSMAVATKSRRKTLGTAKSSPNQVKEREFASPAVQNQSLSHQPALNRRKVSFSTPQGVLKRSKIEENDDVSSKPSTSRQPDESESQSRAKNDAKNKKGEYYVTDADGTPTEKYSMTFRNALHHGEDLDDDSGDEQFPISSLQTPLSDKWKTEYNNGVQMLVKPDDLPKFETKPMQMVFEKRPRFKLPEKLISIEEPSSSTHYVTAESHEIVKIPNQRFYQGDEMDMMFVKKLNSTRATKNGKPYVTPAVFLNVVDQLEIECYTNIHKILLQPLHSPSIRNVHDEEAACDICRITEFEDEDKMVFCDGCNICVHMSCYGLEEVPQEDEDWLCLKCQLCADSTPSCVLCPTIGGAMKCTKHRDRWAHVSCALWLPECRFGDHEKREPIAALEEIADERWQLKCSICDTRQGACIQCTHKGCSSAFHVTCALRSECTMKIEQDPTDPTGDRIAMISLCTKHTIGGNSGHNSDGEGTSSNCENESNEKLKILEKSFYIHADFEKIAKRMKLNEFLVSDIYEYWKQKRSRKGGKSLIVDPQDKIVIATDSSITLNLPSMSRPLISTKSKSISSNSKKTFFREEANGLAPNKVKNEFFRGVRNVLDKDRNCLTMVVRREKLKLQKVQAEANMYKATFAYMNNNVMSNRAAEGILEYFKEFMTSEEIEEAEKLAKSMSRPKSPIRNGSSLFGSMSSSSDSSSSMTSSDSISHLYGFLEEDEQIEDDVVEEVVERVKLTRGRKNNEESSAPASKRKSPSKRRCLSSGSVSVNPPLKKLRTRPDLSKK